MQSLAHVHAGEQNALSPSEIAGDNLAHKGGQRNGCMHGSLTERNSITSSNPLDNDLSFDVKNLKCIWL
jgi:hypothetical protein